MQDPIGSFERIRELYISYLDTAFRIRDPSIAEERRFLLRQPGTLTTEPLVEPLPRYAWEALDDRYLTLEDIYANRGPSPPLAAMPEPARRAFVELLLAGLFPSAERLEGGPLRRTARFRPYRHQVQMLARGLRPCTPAVVTSGTGSGKTEAFLLPLLARIAQEATTWPEPEGTFLRDRWWHDQDGRPYRKVDRSGRTVIKFEAIPLARRPRRQDPLASPFRRHRLGERRRAAVRAIIIYPMNALVEDQLVRLRRTLDSREAREVMDDHFHGNRIFFGRYTGATPVTGHQLHPGLRHLLDTTTDVDGDIYFPGHATAGPDGRVPRRDIRDGELQRRQRKLSELFDDMVGLERGQIQARLHALDRGAAKRLREDLSLVQGTPAEAAAFVEAARRAGRRGSDGLLRDFLEYVGRDPSAEEREALRGLALCEADAAAAPSALDGDDSPFMFSSVDGAEMTNRWDMQDDPPDILITNVSMLSAMLNREVEQPIFTKTREWLQAPDSCFYLILDELHLHRGAAGTEVSYLLRLLLHRLGLAESAEQRRKIRILASSASLPSTPEEEARASARYLWDMFGPFGLDPGSVRESDHEAWLGAIVPGEELSPRYSREAPPLLDPGALRAFLEAHAPREVLDPDLPWATSLSALPLEGNDAVRAAWSRLADALGLPEASAYERVHATANEAAERLAWACREEDEQRPGELRSRAITLGELANKLFAWPARGASNEARLEAVRGLLFVRGCADGLGDRLPRDRGPMASFRVHTFFRSIEGLYAPATRALGSPDTPSQRHAHIGVLSIDQAARIPIAGSAEGHRLFEILYCECCGELFIGGMRAEVGRRSRYLAELLPQEPNLEGLPDQAVSQRFEDLSWSKYGLFWPRGCTSEPFEPKPDPKDRGAWIRAYLERQTGGILPDNDQRIRDNGLVLPGWYYDRHDGGDAHQRDKDSAGTQVPYACPSCGTSYRGRRLPYLLSPIRSFRTGFAKTTQLLATELFDAERISDQEGTPKLVSFSDSRQDAAKAALSIERFHHQDLRREILWASLRAARARKDAGAARARASEVRAALPPVGNPLRELAERFLGELERAAQDAEEPSVALRVVLEDPNEVGGAAREVSPYIAEMVRLGVHPYDDAGQDRPLGKEADKTFRFPWNTLFVEDEKGRRISWSQDREQPIATVSAREAVVSLVYRSLTDVVFSKTYFSFEEAGLGFVSIASSCLPDARRTRARVLELAAFLRVLADAYRYWPTPYRDTNERHAPWSFQGEVEDRRVLSFADAAWPDDPRVGLELALGDLVRCGHPAGIIQMTEVRIELASPSDPFVRCSNCGRVHLHQGVGACTRCFVPMAWPQDVPDRVAHLHARNFLARRLLRSAGGGSGQPPSAFRLHCEELTGQTADPATRQREFRGIFLPRLSEVEAGAGDGDEPEGVVLGARDTILQRKDEIDLLTVTTTMEVGIDIGPLQAILQANMPPQRFNYQQRVGRAGRRGQAFSIALTLCRTKSHDLFYFRHPKKITGDIPPTPFLTKTLPNIARRFLHKGWLWEAFASLREQVRAEGGIYPGDLLSPPDIHGEYLPTAFLPRADGIEWRQRVAEALRRERPHADALARLLSEGGTDFVIEADEMKSLEQIDAALAGARQAGLAHALAEKGYLPMYGMPTRVRQMYLGLRFEGTQATWNMVGRDLDLAIYEFAPGSNLVIDKREHLAIGFTPDLANPVPGLRQQGIKTYQASPFGSSFRLLECPVCRFWKELGEADAVARCDACRCTLDVSLARDCRVPNAFRTDLPAYPRTGREEADAGVRHRSIQAEGEGLELAIAKEFGPAGDWTLAFVQRTSRTFRLNRGSELLGNGRAFEIRLGKQAIAQRGNFFEVSRQAISTAPPLQARVANFQPEGAEARIWLAAPKTTAALYLAPHGARPGLAFHRLPGRDGSGTPPPEVVRWLGVRSAAISATYLIVNKAALLLDIDPEEFDVLEPRLHGDAPHRPLLHFTDYLVNGAGFCEHLASRSDGDPPQIARCIESILLDRTEYPLLDFLSDNHGACDTSCYRCLRRYGNQPFHALLDWQLGLAFLRAMVDPAYRCGLDGRIGEQVADEFPELAKWPAIAHRLSEEMRQRFGGESTTFGPVPAFRVRLPGERLSPWVLVAHPLWDWCGEGQQGSILADARSQAAGDEEALCWDTFNLSRRQVFVRERIREQARGTR